MSNTDRKKDTIGTYNEYKELRKWKYGLVCSLYR